MTSIEITRFIISRLDRPESLIKHVKDKSGHDSFINAAQHSYEDSGLSLKCLIYSSF